LEATVAKIRDLNAKLAAEPESVSASSVGDPSQPPAMPT
jgi:hypothetical protein